MVSWRCRAVDGDPVATRPARGQVGLSRAERAMMQQPYGPFGKRLAGILSVTCQRPVGVVVPAAPMAIGMLRSVWLHGAAGSGWRSGSRGGRSACG